MSHKMQQLTLYNIFPQVAMHLLLMISKSKKTKKFGNFSSVENLSHYFPASDNYPLLNILLRTISYKKLMRIILQILVFLRKTFILIDFLLHHDLQNSLQKSLISRGFKINMSFPFFLLQLRVYILSKSRDSSIKIKRLKSK